MNKTFVVSLLFLVFMASMSSCRTMKEPEFRSIENIRLQGFSATDTLLSLDMIYFNPNNSTLKLKKAEGRVFINDAPLGDFRMDSLIRINRHADFTLPLYIKIDKKTLMKNSLAALLNPVVQIRFEGKAKVGKGFIYSHYPFNYQQEFNLMELLLNKKN